MDLALLVARLVLAGVFVTAGVAKLADLQGARRAAAEFGVPARFAPVVGVVLPIAEIAIGVALVPVATARLAAIAAFALLTVFIAAIGLNLARGRTPDCHCFGQMHSAPAGRQTLARNSILALVAALIILGGWDDPGYSPVTWLGDLSGIETALLVGWIVTAGGLAAIGWVVANLITQNGRILLRLEELERGRSLAGATLAPSLPGLPVATPAPDFALPNIDGRTMTLGTLRSAGAPILLVFSDPGCGPCNVLMPDVARWQRELAGRLTVAVISRGDTDANRIKAREHGLGLVLLQHDREVARAYGAHGTPAAVLIGVDGTIGEPLVGGIDAVRELVERVTGSRRPQPARAPGFQLPDLGGTMVTLASLRSAGTPVLLLFTHPSCDPCNAMLPEIERWQREHADRLTIALVSAGDADANRRAMEGYEVGPILLQRELEIVTAFGIAQAPAAVAVQPSGFIDGDPAYGEHAIRQLVARMTGTPAPSGNGHQGMSQPPLGIGDPAPAVSLPNLDGAHVDLAGHHGAETTLLFWNPGCGFCQQLVEDVKDWERRQAGQSRRLVIISTGSVEATRAHGFRSDVLIDHGLGVGQRFGSHGTPAAIRLDAEGRVASPLAAGMNAVRAMLGSTAGAAATPVTRGDNGSDPSPA